MQCHWLQITVLSWHLIKSFPPQITVQRGWVRVNTVTKASRTPRPSSPAAEVVDPGTPATRPPPRTFSSTTTRRWRRASRRPTQGLAELFMKWSSNWQQVQMCQNYAHSPCIYAYECILCAYKSIMCIMWKCAYIRFSLPLKSNSRAMRH